MRQLRWPDGTTAPALGQGSWRIAQERAARSNEIAALRRGLDPGLRLIDTAEMYGEGAAEELIGEAIAGRRDEVFLVSKVSSHNASRAGVEANARAATLTLDADDVAALDAAFAPPRRKVPLEMI